MYMHFKLQLIAALFFTLCISCNKETLPDSYDALRIKWYNRLTGGPYMDINDPLIQDKVQSITQAGKEAWDSMQKPVGSTTLWSHHIDYKLNNVTIVDAYRKLKSMALAYRTKNSEVYNNKQLRDDILSSLDYMHDNWFNKEIGFNPGGNWYQWAISIPQNLVDIMTLMYDELTPLQKQNFSDAIKVQYRNDKGDADQPLISVAYIVLGACTKDSSIIIRDRDILDETSYKIYTYDEWGENGFYDDGSVLEHSGLPYTSGYGLEWIRGVTDVLWLLSDSPWRVTNPDALNVLDWIRNSFIPVIDNNGMMPDCLKGRGLMRGGTSFGIISSIISAVDYFVPEDSEMIKGRVKFWIENNQRKFYASVSTYEYKRVQKSLEQTESLGHITSSKVYPLMSTVIHIMPDWAFTARMISRVVKNYEIVNQENLKGWHQGDGWTMTYNRDVNKFNDHYWPTVNWHRLPGTTIVKDTEIVQGIKNLDTWAGGTGLEGKYSVAGMIYRPEKNATTLTYKKSWFMFDNSVIAMGSDIKDLSGNEVETIVENIQLNNNGDNALLVNGILKPNNHNRTENLTGVSWIYLEGNVPGSDMGYYFPGKAVINVIREARTGSYKEIHMRMSEELHTRNFLTLWFNHRTNPSDQTYSYVLFPNTSKEKVASYATDPDILILENSNYAHGISEKRLGIEAANFWTDRRKTVGMITSNNKASVMIRNTGDELLIAVSDPTMVNEGTIELEINQNVISLVNADNEIIITQLSPVIRMIINVKKSGGKTFSARFKNS
jgi:hyaluronate lyase